MVELFSTMLNGGCLLLLSFLILRLPFAFLRLGVNKLFDQTDDGDNKEENYKQEGDEYDTSLAVLNDCIGHGFKTQFKLIINRMKQYHGYSIHQYWLLEVTFNNRQCQFILISMKSPLQSPKVNKSATKKTNLSQQISPTKAQITKTDPSPIKIVQVSKSAKRTESSIQKKRYMMRTNSVLDNDIGYEMQQKQKDLKHKMQRLCSCIDLFNLMQGNNMQLRCVQHSNILTLYCLTERKVLCVNCNYGEMKHKTHKILPLKDSNSHISEDNTLLKEMLNKDLKTIEQSIRSCQQNSMLLENQMKLHIRTIQKQYTAKLEELKSKYEQQIQKIKRNFTTAINKSISLQRDIESFKFKIWETISKVGTGKRSQTTSNQTEIVRQVVCSNLAEFIKFELRKMGKKDMEKLLHKSKFS